MDKKDLSETDIRTKHITSALVKVVWDLQAQVREEVPITQGRIRVKGQNHQRGQPKFADHLLYYKPNIPLAVIEAKDNNHTLGYGMQQALNYSQMHGDPLDLICHVDYGQPPLTRGERANRARKRDYFAKYGDQARLVLDALLDKYVD
jgi:type I site-specific restriction endonuclease